MERSKGFTHRSVPARIYVYWNFPVDVLIIVVVELKRRNFKNLLFL